MSMARVRGPGHPDQACDLVAASIVQEYVRRDPLARLNVHVAGGRGVLFVAGDTHSSADFDVSAVVKRVLGATGVSASFEPFIAFEPMNAAWAAEASREPIAVTGYATAESPDLLPRHVSLARELARELERRRVGDADWFWLGSDYEVSVFEGSPMLAIVRAEHLDTVDAQMVRDRIAAVLADRVSLAGLAPLDIRINVSGEESKAGLSQRMGASGRASSVESIGLRLPSNSSGVGRHPSHPLQAGAWLARACARELVLAGKGQAVVVQLAWLPSETKPHLIRARNEKGENLTPLLDPSRFDLTLLPEAYRAANLGTEALRHPYDATASLPWENV